MNFIHKFLVVIFDDEQSPLRFVLGTSLFAFLLTISILFISDSLGAVSGSNTLVDRSQNFGLFLFSTLIVAPLLENLLLAGVVSFLSDFVTNKKALLLIVGIGFGALHWIAAGWRAIAGTTLFCVMAYSYLLYTSKTFSFRFMVITAQHILFNTPATVSFYFDSVR